MYRLRIAMKVIELEQTVACHEDWDKMTGDEKSRVFARCSHTIVNFSEYTERQAVKLVHKELKSGDFCGVFEVMEGRIIFEPEPIKFRNLKAAALAISLTLPAMAGCGELADADPRLDSKVTAQQESVSDDPNVDCANSNQPEVLPAEDSELALPDGQPEDRSARVALLVSSISELPLSDPVKRVLAEFIVLGEELPMRLRETAQQTLPMEEEEEEEHVAINTATSRHFVLTDAPDMVHLEALPMTLQDLQNARNRRNA
jgi:hypothetical protein